MPYIKELRVKRGVLMILSCLQDSMDHIIAILITYYVLEYFEILKKKLIEVNLRLWWRVTADSTLDNIWRYFLGAIICQVFAYEFSHLKSYLVVIVLQNLLDYIVSKLVVNKLAQWCETNIHQSSLNIGVFVI